ncbi:MAG TPA: hypothetical protein VND67_08035 [Acidimicrobiales bacterium]|nr:hypothetical protein [Acidimicrobiales bacterium]
MTPTRPELEEVRLFSFGIAVKLTSNELVVRPEDPPDPDVVVVVDDELLLLQAVAMSPPTNNIVTSALLLLSLKVIPPG